MENVVGLGKRFFSFILDFLIINLVIIYPFRGMFIKYFNGLTIRQAWSSNNLVLPSSAYWAILIISMLALLYFTFFDYYLGQTPGKMLLKIKIISTKDDKKGVDMWRALLRNCFVLPFFPFYIFWFVEPIYLAFYKERFLEKITSTKTVNEDDSNRDSSKRYTKEYKLDKV
jgi:uncharacterized RDD family membrane protein YckC